jgi:YVTN family beta-propeller protein
MINTCRNPKLSSWLDVTVVIVFTVRRASSDKTSALTFLALLVLISALVAPSAHAQDEVVANVGVGSFPFGLAYDSGKGEVFVANSFSNIVSVISDSTDKVVANITVGSNPNSVAYDSAKGEVFIVDESDKTVSVISASSAASSSTSTTSSTSTSTSPISNSTSSSNSTISTSFTTTTTPTSVTSQSSTTTQTSASSSTGGGVPAFPYQLGIASAFTVLLAAFYLLVRRRTAPLRHVSQGKAGDGS